MSNTPVPLDPGERLHERLARQLARDIVARRMGEGDIVPPAEQIADDYGVSRTVAREALQALAHDGLILVRHGKRTVVQPPSEWHFLSDLVKHAIGEEQLDGQVATDLFETRAILEMHAAELCGARATDEELSQLLAFARDTVETYRGITEGRSFVPMIVHDDLHFHGAIARGTGNEVLRQIITDVRRELVPTWALEKLSHQEVVGVAEGHVEIAELLAARDIDGAVEAMRRHLDWSRETTLKRALTH